MLIHQICNGRSRGCKRETTSKSPTIRPESNAHTLFRPLTIDSRASTIDCIEGRLSSMAKQPQQRVGLLQGTLDMLILRTLLYGPAHGHQIGKHIQRTTNEFLQMQHGSLYPALHRLEKRGWVVSKWEMAPDRNREFKYYRLTEKGRKQLLVEESQWKQMAEAVARIMWPAAEES